MTEQPIVPGPGAPGYDDSPGVPAEPEATPEAPQAPVVPPDAPVTPAGAPVPPVAPVEGAR